MEKRDLKLLDGILVFDNQRFFESWPLCGYDHYAIFYECFRYYYKEEIIWKWLM